jgi:DNA ligase (NAD+)
MENNNEITNMTDKTDRIKRIRELAEQLSEAAKAYYDEDREIMANIEYDRLYDELVALEEETGIVLAGSPTQRVGYSVSSELLKESHPSPMLSLNKTKDPAELAGWLADKEGLLSWKLDGLTVALTYEGGRLTKAVTRGDGVTGEVITANARAFDNLPVTIPYKGELVLRGEAVIRYSDFELINAGIADADAKYKNPRNLASGSVRQLDSAVTAKRHVRFYAFGLVGITSATATAKATDTAPATAPADFLTRQDQLNFIAQQGFDVVEYYPVTADTVESEVKNFAGRAGIADLPSDGLVLIYNDIKYGESLGRTAKYPKDGIAFKWEDELAETTLKEIEWSASRTGLINPIAVFAPVEIEGTTVSRASLHNVSIMEELALGAGDHIRVYKANMIIPQIYENLTKSGTEKPPETCPVCGGIAEVHDNGGVRALFCQNPQCAAKQIGSFTHFVSRNALNVEGLSEKVLEKLIDRGFVSEYADLFKLERHKDEIILMEGLGEKSYANLIENTDIARHTTRARLLYALGIPQIGAANAKVIAKSFDYDWARITQATADELISVDGVGEVMVTLYTEWFSDDAHRQIVSHLMEKIEFAEESAVSGGQLDGKVFVITGSLETYTNREALKEAIESYGGKVTGSVSEKTSYLINNDSLSNSSKNKKAKQLGVEIITEAQLNEMLDHPAGQGDV